MASFEEHIRQAKSNLSFLLAINQNQTIYWDWQVTACFYVMVHLINAHIAKKINVHYRTHADVENAINTFSQLSPARVDEITFTAYKSLRNLSRRSRYLIHEKTDNTTPSAHFTYDKHLRKAITQLDKVMLFMEKQYNTRIETSLIKCPDFRSGDTYRYFEKG